MRRMFAFLLMTAALWADGGKVQFKRQAGAYEITLFSGAAQVRVGKNDLSVLIQKTADQSAVLDADVRIHLEKHDSTAVSEVLARATHDRATNKLLYAALVDIPSTGKWRTEVSAERGTEETMVTGELDVLPPEPPLLKYWPYFLVPPVLILLFVFNQRLKRRRAG